MVLVSNYALAIICCIYCCLCWGSWSNTLKMVQDKKWSFELYYWDLTIGLFVTALVGALTLGTFGSDGPSFIDNLREFDFDSLKWAILGGVVWNFANIFLTAAIAIAGMSIGFPIGGGLGWIGGILFNYLLIILSGEVYPGNSSMLWIGIAIIIAAILICGKVYGMISATNNSTPVKGILLAVVSGIGLIFFYGLIVKSLSPEYVAGGTGTLTPYTGIFGFAIGILVSTPIFNAIAMRNPVEGNKVTMADYRRGSIRTHLIGILGGVIWMSGMIVSFMGAGSANPAVAYALSNAAPVVAVLWGFFVWKEFKGASRATLSLLATMFVLFVVGLVIITLSN